MHYAVSIEITKDEARPALRRLRTFLDRPQLHPLIGRAGVNHVQAYLRSLDASRPNRLGGTRSHFYAAAATATNFRSIDNGVIISINHEGIALRYFGTAGLPGGVLRPVNRQRLAIPIDPEAHGRSPREFSNLEVIFRRRKSDKALLMGLAVKDQADAARAPRGRRQAASSAPNRPIRILYWLKKEVTQDGDYTVLPTMDSLGAHIVTEIDRHLETLWQRQHTA